MLTNACLLPCGQCCTTSVCVLLLLLQQRIELSLSPFTIIPLSAHNVKTRRILTHFVLIYNTQDIPLWAEVQPDRKARDPPPVAVAAADVTRRKVGLGGSRGSASSAAAGLDAFYTDQSGPAQADAAADDSSSSDSDSSSGSSSYSGTGSGSSYTGSSSSSSGSRSRSGSGSSSGSRSRSGSSSSSSSGSSRSGSGSSSSGSERGEASEEAGGEGVSLLNLSAATAAAAAPAPATYGVASSSASNIAAAAMGNSGSSHRSSSSGSLSAVTRQVQGLNLGGGTSSFAAATTAGAATSAMPAFSGEQIQLSYSAVLLRPEAGGGLKVEFAYRRTPLHELAVTTATSSGANTAAAAAAGTSTALTLALTLSNTRDTPIRRIKAVAPRDGTPLTGWGEVQVCVTLQQAQCLL
jgi:hypothetical protein